MKRTKWSVGYRNKLASLSMEVDTPAAENASITNNEHYHIQSTLIELVRYIDKQLNF